MKKCSKCKQDKPLDQFHNMVRSTDGKQKTCKSCQKAYSQSDVCKQNRKAYYQRTREQHISRNLTNLYGISYEQYADMLDKQQGQCCICKAPSHNNGRLHVDHCHRTGKVRGLLCHYCNTMIGLAKESGQTLQSAINYLNEHET
jgi:hypothetical protein